MVKILNRKYVTAHLPRRPQNANKGTFGKVLIIAGSENYPGAAYLCCAACLRVGCGLVTLVTSQSIKNIVSKKLPEMTFLSYKEVLKKIDNYDVFVLGPGLGQKNETIRLIRQLTRLKLPKTVIDGDGLNILAKTDNWWKKLRGEAILTPHPGEMSRLTNLTIEQIQSNRENIAKEFSKKWNQVLVLKGANTIIVSPFGKINISPFANPLMATAGTGDVLAGVIAGFIAQGLDLFDGACLGVFVHGMAGELVREKLGDSGMLASDLLPKLPLTIKKLKGK